MFEFLTTDKELEEILTRLNMNASNNYKDAAHKDQKADIAGLV